MSNLTFFVPCHLSTHCFSHGHLSSPIEKKGNDFVCLKLQGTSATNFEIKLDNRNVSYTGLLRGTMGRNIT